MKCDRWMFLFCMRQICLTESFIYSGSHFSHACTTPNVCDHALLYLFRHCTCRVFDRKQKGYIEGADLKVTMKQLGVTLTSEDVKAMMHDAGVKADGRIFYEGELSLLLWGHSKVFSVSQKLKSIMSVFNASAVLGKRLLLRAFLSDY